MANNNKITIYVKTGSTEVQTLQGNTLVLGGNPTHFVNDLIKKHNTSETAHPYIQERIDGKQDTLSSTQMDAVNSGANATNIAQIGTNANAISNIEEKIPSQASDTNQLADKNFVNSSVATNTANFIGTFQSYADLEAYAGTVTNNDYAFVIDEDSAGNTLYLRYKYSTAVTPAAWVFEYELNNSSFTANQWAAINSGITDTLVTQIGTNTTAIAGKQDTLVSGTNIKTINNNSLLGSGDLTLDGLPSQTGQSGKFLTTDGTDASWGNALANLATGSYSLAIIGSTRSSSSAVAVGYGSDGDGDSSVCIGRVAKSKQNGTSLGFGANTNFQGTAIGYMAKSTGNYAIQIGQGTNSTASTLSVGLDGSNNYELLNASGKIPAARLPAMVGSDGVNAGTAGAVPAPGATDNTKFLKGDGTWASIPGALPSQTGQSGKFLTTDGTDASWADVSIPNNVYTEDNLVAGTNITLSDKTISGGVDEHTISLLHFNDNTTDDGYYSASNIITASGDVYGTGKFDKAIYQGDIYCEGVNWPGTINQITLDFWIYISTQSLSTSQSIVLRDAGMGILFDFFAYHYNSGKYLLARDGNGNTIYDAACPELVLNDWNHIAVEVANNSMNIFVGGTKVTTQTTNVPTISTLGRIDIFAGGPYANPQDAYDELRVSDVLRYNGTDFTVPTQPYSSTGTTVKTINCDLDIDNNSITTNSSDELQTVGVIDQNNTANAIKTWTGTKAQYDAILSKDANTLYSTTDEPGDSTEFADTSLSNLSDAGKIVGAGLGMPSSTYTDLTLGASGATYTAPANGYYDLRKAGNMGQYAKMGAELEQGQVLAANGIVSLFLPVKKGQTMTLYYDLSDTTYVFRFVYAVGSVSEAN